MQTKYCLNSVCEVEDVVWSMVGFRKVAKQNSDTPIGTVSDRTLGLGPYGILFKKLFQIKLRA